MTYRTPTRPKARAVPGIGASVVIAEIGGFPSEDTLHTLRLAGHRLARVPGGETRDTRAGHEMDAVIIYASADDPKTYQLLREIQASDPHAMRLVVSPGASESGVILSFRAGADDVMVGADRSLELEARISALLRRGRAPVVERIPDREIVMGEFRLDPSSRSIWVGCRPRALTPSQFRVMLALMRGAGRAVPRDWLNDAAGVQSTGNPAGARSLDTHILQLRRIVENTPSRPRHILTVRQVGYRFDAAGTAGKAAV